MWISAFKKKAVKKIEETKIELKIEEKKIPDFKDLENTETQIIRSKKVYLSNIVDNTNLEAESSKHIKF